jgi:hypothetical protein
MKRCGVRTRCFLVALLAGLLLAPACETLNDEEESPDREPDYEGAADECLDAWFEDFDLCVLEPDIVGFYLCFLDAYDEESICLEEAWESPGLFDCDDACTADARTCVLACPDGDDAEPCVWGCDEKLWYCLNDCCGGCLDDYL